MKVKNKTKNNEKLARNTIRVRNNQNKQDKNGKRSLFKRMFAIFLVVLLLVSMLCVSASADIPKDSVDLEGYFIYVFTGGEDELISGGFYSPVPLFDAAYLADSNVYFSYGGRFGKVREFYYEIDTGRTRVGLVVEFADGTEFIIADTVGMGDYILYTDRQLEDIARRDVLDYVSFYYEGNVAGDETKGFFGVASTIMTWIANALASVQSVFYQNGSLTLLGTLAIVGVFVALGWLIIGIVTRFLQLRG